MPTRRKRRNKNKSSSNQQYSTNSEFTIHEYANAEGPEPPSRLKKSAVNAIFKEVRVIKSGQEVMLSDRDTDKDWFDKDDDDLVNGINDLEENEDEDEVVTGKKVRHTSLVATFVERVSRLVLNISLVPEAFQVQSTKAWNSLFNGDDPPGIQNGTNRKKNLESLVTGIRYPLDIWYIIAPYIHPEDVSIFFRLCKDAYSLSNSLHFWKKLYLRHCLLHQSHLPDNLHEYCIELRQGLCQRVIRSLYHVYPPFVHRNSRNLPFQDQPYSLSGQVCLFTWQEQETIQSKSVCLINFKLKDNAKKSSKQLPGKVEVDKDDDIHYNEENHCCMLQVTCLNFIQVAPCMGLYLRHARMRVSHASMRYYSLQLVFDSGVTCANSSAGQVTGMDTVVTLDPVIDIHVFKWWHPKYRHYSV